MAAASHVTWLCVCARVHYVYLVDSEHTVRHEEGEHGDEGARYEVEV